MSVTCFVVDVETDGPNTSEHSMFWFGAVVLTEDLTETFEGRLCPIFDTYVTGAQEVSGKSRNEVLTWPKTEIVMPKFVSWVEERTRPGTKPQVWSDNNSYDLKWLNNYVDQFTSATDLFGHSSRNISDRHKGLMEGRAAVGLKDSKRLKRSFKHLRKTVHDHNPVNDAIGNAEALLALRSYGLKIQVQK